MNPPAPDALLLAKLLPEWPDELHDACQVVFFYLTRKHREKMSELGYPGDCGIGKPGNHKMNIPRLVEQLKGSDIARVALVFEPEPDRRQGLDGDLGRDISKAEWEEAHAYLIETGERRWPLDT